MTLFQIRYTGAAAPEPETLAAADVDDAVRAAQQRLEASGAEGAVLSRDGAVIRRLPESGGGAALERRLIEAGIYVFATATPA